ncbi:MAG: AMP-binding protein [Candidatus Eisenbacteria bacterium]|nr:AMP-binding protein [Candidatus Eisenbacteria bacterium]
MSGFAEKVYRRAPVGIQNLLVSEYGRRIRRERFGDGFEEAARFLERSERLDPEEHRAYQDERVASLVRHAYETVPYYRDVMDDEGLVPADVTCVDDLSKLPLLTRETVIREREGLVSTAVNRGRLRFAATSGTTGYPVSVYWDRRVIVMNNACSWRAWNWAGFSFGRPFATLMGEAVVPLGQRRPPYWRYNSAWNQYIFSSYHLDEASVGHYLDALRRLGVEALAAYPSSAYLLARYMEERDERLPLTCVVTSSEPLLPVERGIIEDRFDCRVFDTYGQAERVAFSSECEEHNGHHVFPEYGVLEILGVDGRPVAPGEHGQIVATGLHNEAMPLIRYATGDTAAERTGRCPCGRTLPMIAGITGKAEDIVVLPGDRMIPGPLLSYAFKGVPGIIRSQIVQHDPSEVTVRIVPDASFDAAAETTLTRELGRRLGRDVSVGIERVSEIPFSSRGKFRWVVSTVPLKWGDVSTANLYTEEETSAGS